MSYFSEYINRARYIYRSEGIIALLRRLFSYLASYIVIFKQYYVRQHFVGELEEADFLPKVKDFTFKLIDSNEVANDWARSTGFDFRDQILHARQRLEAGGVAFCIFCENKLASINWVGLTQKAKDLINPQPYKVDFWGQCGCTGGAETIPKYRGKRLMAYACYHRNNYMKKHGLSMLIGIDEINNIAIYMVQSMFPSRICAKARYIKFLWWKYWKETPVPEDFIPHRGAQ